MVQVLPALASAATQADVGTLVAMVVEHEVAIKLLAGLAASVVQAEVGVGPVVALVQVTEV